jgi:YidC/Oxa1 family membrane protein insertase
MTVRLLLFPLFVKQIKSQRRMQELAPKIKELQKLHKGDRETLNVEMMKLYKENNANPISGACRCCCSCRCSSRCSPSSATSRPTPTPRTA